jgi:hypothetical protein
LASSKLIRNSFMEPAFFSTRRTLTENRAKEKSLWVRMCPPRMCYLSVDEA